MKVKVVVDSTADTPEEWVKSLGIEIVPLYVHWPDGTVEKDTRPFDRRKFWDRLKNSRVLPTTSQPSVEDFTSVFKKAREEGYDAVFCLLISSKISGTVNSAKLAAENSPIPIYIWDSRMDSSAIAQAARLAKRLLDEGRRPEEVLKILDRLRDKRWLQAIFFVSDIDYLVKGGRLSAFKGAIAKMLSIRPIVHFEDDGSMTLISRERGEKRAILYIVNYIKRYVGDRKVRFTVPHTDAEESAKRMKRALEENFNVEECVIVPMNRITGIHVGPGMVGVGVEVVEWEGQL